MEICSYCGNKLRKSRGNTYSCEGCGRKITRKEKPKKHLEEKWSKDLKKEIKKEVDEEQKIIDFEEKEEIPKKQLEEKLNKELIKEIQKKVEKEKRIKSIEEKEEIKLDEKESNETIPLKFHNIVYIFEFSLIIAVGLVAISIIIGVFTIGSIDSTGIFDIKLGWPFEWLQITNNTIFSISNWINLIFDFVFYILISFTLFLFYDVYKDKAKSREYLRKKKNVKKIILISFFIIFSIVLFFIIDVDGDGLSNLEEIQNETLIFNSDSDNDRLGDGAEINNYMTNPKNSDSDSDGLNDYEEIINYNSDPNDDDSDNDNLKDGDEVRFGTDLFDTDSDDDGIKDGSDSNPTIHDWKLIDSDNDGWNDYKEYYEEGTDRFNKDTDGDGAPDGYDVHPLSTSKKVRKYYEWYYPPGRKWTWEIYVSYDLYVYEAQLDRIHSLSKWSEYTLDPTAKQLASHLKNSAKKEGYTYYQTIDFVLAFVQSLPYTSDDLTVGYNYPRYPLETLYDDGGDCEDTSILFSSILREMNYDNCLTVLPKHVMVSVWGDSDYPGSYYEKNGKKYYCCETTGNGWKMGVLPSDFRGKSASLYNVEVPNPVYPPNPRPDFSVVDSWNSEYFEGFNRIGYVYVKIKNNGDPGSRTVYVTVTQGFNQWTKTKSQNLGSYESFWLTFTFPEIGFLPTEPWSYRIRT